MTVHCWGEDPRGLWTVIVTDNDNNNRKHYLEKLTQGDEEDVTRIFLDDTGKHHRPRTSGPAQDHVLKTMEDTAGKLFHGNGFAKFVHRKKAHNIRSQPRITSIKKKRPVRYHHKESKKAGTRKDGWKTANSNKTKVTKAKQKSRGMARKNTHPKTNVVKDQQDEKPSKINKLTSKTAFMRKQEKLKTTLGKEDSDRKTDGKPQKTSQQKTNTTLTPPVPNIVTTLNKSSASVLRNLNTSDNEAALNLITKLISEIQKNPLVTKIAFEALRNPAIGKLFGIDSLSDVVEKIQEKFSLSKTVEQFKDFKNESGIGSPHLKISNQTVTRKEKLNTTVVDANSDGSGAGVKELARRPATVNSIKHRRIQFFKILKDIEEASYIAEVSGSGIGESGNSVDSASGNNPDESGSGNVVVSQSGISQSLSCVPPKNCSGTQREDTSMPGSGKPPIKIPKELEGEDDLFGEYDEDAKESQYGDGDGNDFFENMKNAVERNDSSDHLVPPHFGLDRDNINEHDKSLCSNFSVHSSNDSDISRTVHCPENRSQADDREREDKTLAHYLAVDKLKSVPLNNDMDSIKDSSSSQNLIEDRNSSGEEDSSDSKYSGKDLEVLQEALEEQLSRLSKDPSSQKSSAEILARVRDDINHGDIDDLELLEAQITDGKTDLSRSVRSLSPEDEQIDDLDDFADITPEGYEEFNEEEDEMERSRISHELNKQKSSETYYVDPNKYGKDNSGILESWTLILYGTK